MEIKFSITSKINKPVEEVFKAVVDPEALSSYFTTVSSGPMEVGETILWKWGSEESEIRVIELEENRTISFRWKAYNVMYETLVEIDFQEKEGETTVTVTESGWQEDHEGLDSSYSHCAGWQHMLTCMKARLEFNVDLRPQYI